MGYNLYIMYKLNLITMMGLHLFDQFMFTNEHLSLTSTGVPG